MNRRPFPLSADESAVYNDICSAGGKESPRGRYPAGKGNKVNYGTFTAVA